MVGKFENVTDYLKSNIKDDDAKLSSFLCSRLGLRVRRAAMHVENSATSPTLEHWMLLGTCQRDGSRS